MVVMKRGEANSAIESLTFGINGLASINGIAANSILDTKRPMRGRSILLSLSRDMVL